MAFELSESLLSLSIYQTLKEDIKIHMAEFFDSVANVSEFDKSIIDSTSFEFKAIYNRSDFSNFNSSCPSINPILFTINFVADPILGRFVNNNIIHPIYRISVYGISEPFVGYYISVIGRGLATFLSHKRLSSSIIKIEYQNFNTTTESYYGFIDIKLFLHL